MAPVQGPVGTHEAPLAPLELDGEDLARIALGEAGLHRGIDLEGVGRRHDLGHQIGLGPRGREHAPAFRGVHGHARLAEHVLARVESGQGHLAVRVWPRPDAHRVDVLGLDDLAPVAVDPADAELLGHALARLLERLATAVSSTPGCALRLGT